jgi:N-dimethylarginine dimethylaminohydrolase
MMELLDAQFETYIDTKTGKQAIRVKQNDDNELDGNFENTSKILIIFFPRCKIRNRHRCIR